MSGTTTNHHLKPSAQRCSLPTRTYFSMHKQSIPSTAMFLQVTWLKIYQCIRACLRHTKLMVLREPKKCTNSRIWFTNLVNKSAVSNLTSMAHLRSTRQTMRPKNTNLWTTWTWHHRMWLWYTHSTCMKQSWRWQTMIQTSSLRWQHDPIHTCTRGWSAWEHLMVVPLFSLQPLLTLYFAQWLLVTWYKRGYRCSNMCKSSVECACLHTG